MLKDKQFIITNATRSPVSVLESPVLLYETPDYSEQFPDKVRLKVVTESFEDGSSISYIYIPSTRERIPRAEFNELLFAGKIWPVGSTACLLDKRPSKQSEILHSGAHFSLAA